MSAPPSFSIICPTYNTASYVGRAIDSILSQSVPPLEAIFSDDGSQDETVALIESRRAELEKKEIRLQILRNAHGGPGAARNAAIAAAKGEWLAFLDADDSWKEHKLRRVAQAIQFHPEANFFVHWEQYHRLEGPDEILKNGSGYRQDLPLESQLYRRNLLSTSAVVCRTSLVRDVGGFDPSFAVSQDYELWLRLSPLIKLHVVEEVLGGYWEHGSSITARPYPRRYWHLLRLLVRHRDKAAPLNFEYRVLRASFSIQWLRWARRLLQSSKGHY